MGRLARTERVLLVGTLAMDRTKPKSWRTVGELRPQDQTGRAFLVQDFGLDPKSNEESSKDL